jgi:putative Mn2+ efflux pump MntP
MLVFGLFEFWVPLIGIWLGAEAARVIALQTNFIGGILLLGLGLLTVVGGIRNRRKDENWPDMLHGGAG